MIDKNVIASRVEQIDKHLEKIDAYRRLSYEEFSGDTVAQDVVEYNLFQITNHIIDISQHIVVDEEYGLPQSAYEAAELLCERNIIDDKDLQLLKRMIGFRNVIGHDYFDINKEIVYKILTEGIDDIKNIMSKLIDKFL